MAYKVLNNVLVKDSAGISSLSTDMLVLIINKNTKNDSSFKELNKKSKNYISKTIQSHIKKSGDSILLPKVDGINAKNILLIKGLDPDTPTHKWLSLYQGIAQKGNQNEYKDISIMPGAIAPKGKDELWLIEMVSKTVESNV